MKCKICGKNSNFLFNKKVLNKYLVNYYRCDFCDFIQTENPYWLEEAYASPISLIDNGLLSRNINLSKITEILLFCYFNKNKTFLDYAGGYGIFVRLMRDIGFDFLWDDKFSKNLFAKGFEWKNDGKISLITTFESFEHFVYPTEEIKKMLLISSNIFFSTELIPDKEINSWSYIAPDHGQHISFYSEKTLKFIAKKFHLNYFFYKNIHLFTKNKKINMRWVYLLFRFKFYFLINKILRGKIKEDNNILVKNAKI